jgi:hypothetical protein
MAARICWADQENTAPSLGLAPSRAKACLPSSLRRVVLAEGSATCAGARYDLRRNARVGGGQDAGLAWESVVRGTVDEAERERTRKALLDYCAQDTLALVRLVQRLRAL